MISNRYELSSQSARLFALSALRANSFAATLGAQRARVAMTADSGRVSADFSGRLAAAFAADCRSNQADYASIGFDGTRPKAPLRPLATTC